MYWRVSEEKLKELDRDERIWWGKDGSNVPAIKRFLTEVKQGMVPQTWWSYEDVGHTQDAKKEIVALFGDDVFGTPKPERLINRIVHISTNPGDLVLDSFLGSGTTAAVAHKMGRRWIGIEMGEHARTHCQPRLEKVVAGEQGGISQSVGWQGGGGFRFFTLGQPVFLADGGINPEIRFPTLAAWVWYQETRTPWVPPVGIEPTPLLGIHEGKVFALLYNGILGDRRPQGGNVLTAAVLAALKALLPEHVGPWLVFGESCRLSPQRLAAEGLRFKQIPYEIKAR